MGEQEPIYGLVCSGGGAQGAYQVGVLKYVHERFCRGDASPFRVFLGTSAGSLNTTFYACRSHDARVAREELERMWLEFHVPEYFRHPFASALWSRVLRRLRFRGAESASVSLLTSGPLRGAVERGFSREALDRSLAAGTTIGAGVSATEVRRSALVWFLEGRAASSWDIGFAVGREARLGVDHVVASCSVPFVFPAVRIDGAYYGDGEVANKTPFAPAIQMGVRRILHIATDRPLAEGAVEGSADAPPTWGDMARMVRGGLQFDHPALAAGWIDLINALSERLPSSHVEELGDLFGLNGIDVRRYRSVEVELFHPSERISGGALELPSVGSRVRSTKLLFHRAFIEELIERGYEDARRRHDRLAWFFDASRSPRPSRSGGAVGVEASASGGG